MFNLRRLMLAASLTLLASLAVATSAAGAPGNGAHVVKESDCVDFGGGFTYCYDLRSTRNETVTPSGNVAYHDNGEIAYRLTGPGCENSGSSRFNFHSLSRLDVSDPDGETQVEGENTRGEFSANCFGENQKCTFRFQLHFANGKTQFVRSGSTCDPPVEED